MIKITQYTRASEHAHNIKTFDNGNIERFFLSISHNNGTYYASWKRETIEHKDGYNTTTYKPFDEDSGRVAIKSGRFSRAFLEKCDKFIADNLQKYYELWQQGEYMQLANELYNNINNL